MRKVMVRKVMMRKVMMRKVVMRKVMMREVMMREVVMRKVMMMMNKGRKEGKEGKESLLGVWEGDGEFNSVRSREEGAGFFSGAVR